MIRLHHLDKQYTLADGRVISVLRDLDLELEPGEITVLVGRSGCGKTTLLRLISGLETPTGGTLEIPAEVKIGMMFQEARLMPWLTCEKNITLGLEKPDPRETREILRLVGLQGFENAYPAQLSGGMQQRTALARTLIRHAGMILMDEPFAALDAFTRAQMQKELLRIRGERRCGVLLVTHSMDEALLLGDRLLLMAKGGICYDRRLPESAGNRDVLAEPFIRIKRELASAIQLSADTLQKGENS